MYEEVQLHTSSKDCTMSFELILQLHSMFMRNYVQTNVLKTMYCIYVRLQLQSGIMFFKHYLG